MSQGYGFFFFFFFTDLHSGHKAMLVFTYIELFGKYI